MKTAITLLLISISLRVNGAGISFSQIPPTNTLVLSNLFITSLPVTGGTKVITLSDLMRALKIDTLQDLGTVANGGTATLVLTTNYYRAAFSGAAATIALPTIASTTNSHSKTIFGTNTSGGSQIITVPTIMREELSSTIPITTFTNNAGALWTFTAVSVAGVWQRAYIIGDALTFGTGGGAPVGTMVASGISTQYRVPKATDTTGTNYGPSGMIGDATGTNMNVLGKFTADNIQTTNGIVPLSVGTSKLVRTDSTGKLAPVTIGTGVSFDGTTLTGTGGGGVGSTTQTNFVLNQLYTNGASTVLVRATVALTGAVIAGSSAMDLMVDQAGGSTFVLLARSALSTSTIAENSTNVVSGIIVPLGTYYWTNSSTGIGNSSLIVAGTGQVSTTGGAVASSAPSLFTSVRTAVELLEEFDQYFFPLFNSASAGVLGLTKGVTGTGAIVGPGTGEGTAPGNLLLFTGTTTTGLAHVLGHGAAFRFGSSAFTNEWRVRFDFLPTTEAYSARIGFDDVTTTEDGLDAVMFRFTAADTHLVCVARSNGSETTATTSTVIVVSTWYRLRIVVNAAGTSATFTINDADTQTISSNVPNGAGRETGLCASILKSAGTTGESISIDYVVLGYGITR